MFVIIWDLIERNHTHHNALYICGMCVCLDVCLPVTCSSPERLLCNETLFQACSRALDLGNAHNTHNNTNLIDLMQDVIGLIGRHGNFAGRGKAKTKTRRDTEIQRGAA